MHTFFLCLQIGRLFCYVSSLCLIADCKLGETWIACCRFPLLIANKGMKVKSQSVLNGIHFRFTLSAAPGR